jgi:hypothetical protein
MHAHPRWSRQGATLSRRTLLAATASAWLAGPAVARAATASAGQASVYWPGNDGSWESVDATAAGFRADALDAAFARALARNSKGLLLLHGGRIVVERYAADWGRDAKRTFASATKSMMAMLVGQAIDDGAIRGVEQSAADFFPAWRDGPKSAITVRHLLSMTSGLTKQGLTRGDVDLAGDQLAQTLALPLEHAPGTHWDYHTVAYRLLFHLVATATGSRFEDYAARRLVGPLGMAGLEWSTAQGRGASGPVTNYRNAGGAARDLARFGLFMARRGTWTGGRLVGEPYFAAATTPSQDLNRAYGYLIWLSGGAAASGGAATAGDAASRLPAVFAANGALGQNALAVPELDMVVVRTGLAPPEGANAGVASDLLREVLAARVTA